MKENAIDVLMYLFKNYIDGELEYIPDRESLQIELQEAGFDNSEINSAFKWLDELANSKPVAADYFTHNNSVRIYTRSEMSVLDTESRGFLFYLEQAKILTPEVREIIIDRVMALENSEIDIEELKWVIVMVLFNQPGQNSHYDWLENLVFEENRQIVH